MEEQIPQMAIIWKVKVFQHWLEEIYLFAGPEAESKARERFKATQSGIWDSGYLYADEKMIDSWADNYESVWPYIEDEAGVRIQKDWDPLYGQH